MEKINEKLTEFGFINVSQNWIDHGDGGGDPWNKDPKDGSAKKNITFG